MHDSSIHCEIQLLRGYAERSQGLNMENADTFLHVVKRLSAKIIGISYYIYFSDDKGFKL